VLCHPALKNASVTATGALECLRLSDKYCSHNENISCFLIQLFEIKFQSKNHSRGKRKLNARPLVNGNRMTKRRVKQGKSGVSKLSKLQFRIIIFFSLENLREEKCLVLF